MEWLISSNQTDVCCFMSNISSVFCHVCIQWPESRLYSHLSFPTSCNTQDPVFLSSCSCVKTNFRNVLIHGIQEPSALCNVFYIPSSRLLTRRWQESVNIHHTRKSLLMLKMKWPRGRGNVRSGLIQKSLKIIYDNVIYGQPPLTM